MGLQELWFLLIAALFLGFLILEGFDFGVGMLMVPFGAVADGDKDLSERHRRAALDLVPWGVPERGPGPVPVSAHHPVRPARCRAHLAPP